MSDAAMPKESVNMGALALGRTYEHDVVDEHNRVLLPAGHSVTAELIIDLQERGVQQVFFRLREKTPRSEPQETQQPVTKVSEDPWLRPYDRQLVAALRKSIQDGCQAVRDVQNRLLEGEPMKADEVYDVAETLIGDTQSTPDTMLSETIVPKQPSSADLRSIQLATISVAAAQQLGASGDECLAVGTAGLMHDVSLRQIARQAKQKQGPLDKDIIRQKYYDHPLKSASILRESLRGISEQSLILVEQVHEHCDGTGFPRGLQKHQLHPLSQLLSIVDAYLTLTDSALPETGFMPADALAYLVYQTRFGTFDRQCVRALIMSTAIYPVGTRVRLDDNSTAIVLRSNGEDYLRPIVQLEDSTQSVIDLRETKLRIEAPSEIAVDWRRFPKTQVNENLWRVLPPLS